MIQVEETESEMEFPTNDIQTFNRRPFTPPFSQIVKANNAQNKKQLQNSKVQEQVVIDEEIEAAINH
jgi:hypothetical protein